MAKKARKHKKPSADKHLGNKKIREYAWKPGQSGNPKGRPKKDKCLTDCLQAELDKTPERLPDGKINKQKLTNAQILAQQAIMHATTSGNQSYYKEIYDRIEGKVKEKHEVSGDVDLLTVLSRLGRGAK